MFYIDLKALGETWSVVYGRVDEVPESGVSRLGFEPRTLGLKVRCSAKLSYRPTKVEGATFTGSNSMDHRIILEACALPFMIPPPTRL